MNGVIRTVISQSVLLSILALSIVPASAQTSTDLSECATKAIESDNAAAQITALGRARNLARQAAEAANGGLGVYRADASMHGRVSDAPCVDNGDGSWTFTVKGGEPGFTTPTKETVVTVNSNGWTVKVDYNGPIRS
ncbi:MAG: hypothetical protein IGS48_17250 [Oscillatoriales cyanobacterium C42_A2020_001]|nr:hypothetical protein [Leptolyngbyaceae cyanobacterium C42_A2020_001]